jgi:hypothetical protein
VFLLVVVFITATENKIGPPMEELEKVTNHGAKGIYNPMGGKII